MASPNPELTSHLKSIDQRIAAARRLGEIYNELANRLGMNEEAFLQVVRAGGGLFQLEQLEAVSDDIEAAAGATAGVAAGAAGGAAAGTAIQRRPILPPATAPADGAGNAGGRQGKSDETGTKGGGRAPATPATSKISDTLSAGSLERINKALEKNQRLLTTNTRRVEQYNAQWTRSGGQDKGAAKGLVDAQNELGRLEAKRRILSRLDAEQKRVSAANTERTQPQTPGNQVDEKALAKLRKAQSQIKGNLSKYGKLVAAAAPGVATAVVLPFLKSAAVLERYRLSLAQVSGSQGEANEALKALQKFTLETPTNMKGATAAFIKLKEAGLDPMGGALHAVGDASATLGIGIDQGAAALSAALEGKHKLLEKQLGIQATTQGDTVTYHYTDREGKQQSRQAKKGDKVGIAATLQGILQERHGGAMEKLQGGWTGIINNASDLWKRFQQMLINSPGFQLLRDRLRGVLDTFNQMAGDGTLQQWVDGVGTRIASVFNAIGTVFGWFARLYMDIFHAGEKLAEFTGGWRNLQAIIAGGGMLLYAAHATRATGTAMTVASGSTKGLAVAFHTLKGAVLSNPIFAAVAVLAAVALVIRHHWETLGPIFTAFWQGLKAGLDPVISQFSGLFDALKQIWGHLAPLREMIGGLFSEIFGASDPASEEFDRIGAAAMTLGDVIGTVFSIITAPIRLTLAAIELVVKAIGGIGDLLTGKTSVLDVFSNAGEGIANTFSNWWSGDDNEEKKEGRKRSGKKRKAMAAAAGLAASTTVAGASPAATPLQKIQAVQTASLTAGSERFVPGVTPGTSPAILGSTFTGDNPALSAVKTGQSPTTPSKVAAARQASNALPSSPAGFSPKSLPTHSPGVIPPPGKLAHHLGRPTPRVVPPLAGGDRVVSVAGASGTARPPPLQNKTVNFTLEANITINAAPGMDEQAIARMVVAKLEQAEEHFQTRARGALYDEL